MNPALWYPGLVNHRFQGLGLGSSVTTSTVSDESDQRLASQLVGWVKCPEVFSLEQEKRREDMVTAAARKLDWCCFAPERQTRD